jgi:diadenosine tetraphosphate (Ap4A) HIT family hydrolase
LKPRYIFCPSHSDDFHFERAPYENIDSKTGDFLHATRFISLADSLNDKQKKWIYALNIEPAKHVNCLTLSKKPDNCTFNPFDPSIQKSESQLTAIKTLNYFFQVPHDEVVGSKRRLDENVSTVVPLKKPAAGYVCKKCHSTDHFYRDCPHQDSKYGCEKKTYVCHICHEPGHNIRDCPKKEEQHQGRHINASSSVTPETCWFCLSNPAARKHLIIDIGEEVYLTLAKGPLTPEHAIIIPIEHVSSNTEDISGEIDTEIKALMFRIRGSLSAVNKTPIFFRLRHVPAHHYHIQMIPIDHVNLPQFLEFLNDYSKKFEFKFRSNHSGPPSFDFMYFEGESISLLSHSFEQDSFFPAQFGRQVLAAFLDVSERSDWKAQSYSEADEKLFVAALKKLFDREK